MAGPQGWVGLVSCAPALPDRHMDILASVTSKWVLGSERGKGQCDCWLRGEGSVVGRSFPQPRLAQSVATGCTCIWARAQVAKSAREAMCSWQPWAGFFTRHLFPKNTVGWAVEMFPVPSPYLSRQRSVDYLTRCLPPLLSPCGSLENQS